MAEFQQMYAPTDPSVYANRKPTQTLEEFLAKYAAWIDPETGNFRGDRANGGEGIGTDAYLSQNGIDNRLNGQNAVEFYNRNIGLQKGRNAGEMDSGPIADSYNESVDASFHPSTFNWGRTLGDFAKNAAITAAAGYGINAGLLGAGLGDTAAMGGMDQVGVMTPIEAGVKTMPELASWTAPTLDAAIPQLTAAEMSLASPALTSASLATPGVVSSGGLLESAGQFLANNKGLATIAGGLLGAATSGDKTVSATSTKDPWAPAQPYLKDNLAQNKAMQDYYRANPFSDQQKQAYQGVFDANANGMANVPGMLSMANNFGSSNKGQMGVMPQFISGVKAPTIDWTKYANIGLLGGKP